MPPEHISLQRSFAILRRLHLGPAGRATLAQMVQRDCDPTAYEGGWSKRVQKGFENDIQRLRDLGIDITYYDSQYHLVDLGEFITPFALGEAELDSLAFLQETFSPGAPEAETVQRLLGTILNWLPIQARRSLQSRRQRLRMDLQRRDNDVITPEVQESVDRALDQHRLLRFLYLSPNQADGIPRRHTVQPWLLYFDTTRRHLYLDAYRVSLEGPYGVLSHTHWHAYRLGRILADGIEVLPDKFPPIPPKRPRHALEYLLAPEIARLGEISRHFDDMQIHPADEAGWVRVTATTSDLFRAVRTLLSYGPMCKVVGGQEARREMGALVRAMAEEYGNDK